jgi:hypothetical protein
MKQLTLKLYYLTMIINNEQKQPEQKAKYKGASITVSMRKIQNKIHFFRQSVVQSPFIFGKKRIDDFFHREIWNELILR